MCMEAHCLSNSYGSVNNASLLCLVATYGATISLHLCIELPGYLTIVKQTYTKHLRCKKGVVK